MKNKLQTLLLNFNRMSQAPSYLPPSVEVLSLDDQFIRPLATDYVKHLPNRAGGRAPRTPRPGGAPSKKAAPKSD